MNLYIKIIYFCLGLGATSPLLSIVLGGRVLSLMSISFILVFIDLIFSQNFKIKLARNNVLYNLFMIWMLISIFASISGLIYFANYPVDYSISAITHIPKILLYLLLAVSLVNKKNKATRVNYLLKGLAFGIALNIIWSIVDAGMFYSMHQSLTNNIFKSYIEATNMHFGTASIIDGISIRSVGLNNDPATIGFFSTVGAAYAYTKKNYWLIIICVIACFACVSFVGLVGIGIVIVYHVLSKSIRVNKQSFFYFFCILLILCVFYSNVRNNEFFNDVNTALELRASSKVEGDHSSETRLLFLKKFPNALMRMPIALILGTGYSTAVYPYYSEGLDYGEGESPTYMENTYIDNFFSFGLIGLIFFFIFYLKMFLISKRNMLVNNNTENDILYAISLGSLISYAFYHYTLYSVIMLASVSAISYYNGKTKINNIL